MRNNFSCKSEFVWNVHIQVTLKVIRSVFQFSTCMSLLRHGCHRHSFMNSQTDSQMYTFPDQMNNLTICPDINGFQIPVKTSCTGHRWCKTKDFFVFCSGKTCLVCFHGFWFFCFICHLCLVHKINAQTPITAILSTYLIHEFILNVKCRMDGLIGNPISARHLISWYNILPMEHV